MDSKRIDNWVTRFGNAGKDGLVLMVDIVNDMAAHRNTDGAGRLAGKVPDEVRSCLARIIRARFGSGLDDKPLVTGKKDDAHANKFTFKLKFQGSNPELTNETTYTWGLVQDAIKRGAHFNDKALHKALREYWKPEKDETAAFDYAGKAKRIVGSVIDGGGNISRMIAELQKLAKAQPKATTETVASPAADTGNADVLITDAA